MCLKNYNRENLGKLVLNFKIEAKTWCDKKGDKEINSDNNLVF